MPFFLQVLIPVFPDYHINNITYIAHTFPFGSDIKVKFYLFINVYNFNRVHQHITLYTQEIFFCDNVEVRLFKIHICTSTNFMHNIEYQNWIQMTNGRNKTTCKYSNGIALFGQIIVTMN